MYEIWIEQAGKEVLRQTLSEGQYTLGRTESNQISYSNPALSRQHLQINVGSSKVSVTDLGSTNGTHLNGQKLTPHQSVTWSASTDLQIGNLTIHIQPQNVVAQAQPALQGVTSPPAGQFIESPFGGSKTYSIISAEANPIITQLGAQPLLIGSDPNAAIHIIAANVVHHHCLVQIRNDQVEVTNLDARNPAILAGSALVTGQPAPWPINYPLQIGSATLQLTDQAAAAAMQGSYRATDKSGRDGRGWRLPSIMIMVGFLVVICLLAFSGLVVQRIRCDSFAASCILSPFGPGQAGDSVAVVSGRATPTLAPVMTGQAAPTRIATVEFEVGEPIPTSAPVECAPDSSSEAGWLELPFPYQGTAPVFGGGAETFRRISQRSRSGGRINSFFDHEFPVYPAIFGGREPDNLDDTLVIFNGLRSADAYSQDTDTADWYSGHSGIDFAPANPREATTPILAPADGRLYLAKIDDDDNHMVWLDHDPDGDGIYQYATLYFHLFPDEQFSKMLAMDERTPISAGQQIGTMGTTGRSSGIHLHFEVRHDIDGDGKFSIFERVDPYGWFPSQEIPNDPWAILAEWVDTKGVDYEHPGILSEYLWVHPLVDIVDSAGECQQVTNVKVDLYNVLGWSVVDPGFTYIARNEQGDILEVGQPHRRTLTILEEELEGIDPSTLSLEWLNPKLDTWFTYKRADAEPRPGGGFTFSAIVDKTGRYVLVAKETVDRVPPATGIALSGDLVDAGSNTYQESVIVTLNPKDRGLILSPIKEVQYSIDCGKSWKVYNEPFEVTLETPHSCGEASAASETIELGQNDFLLLAMSEDSANNIEQPPAQMRFKIQ